MGRFGKAKHRHLRKCHRALLTGLRTSGTLNEHLHSVTKQRKAEDMMRWAGRMNNIRSRAAEAVTRA